MDSKIVKNLGKILLIIVISIIAYVLYKFYIRKEEGFGQLYDNENKFTTEQNKSFWNNMNLQLDYNTDLEKDMLSSFQDAVKNVDPLTKKTKKNNLNSFFRKDPIPGIEKANLVCSTAKEPLLLPAHNDKSASGCGWWYLDDDNKASFGANGSSTGPFSELPKTSPSGKWIWDLATAQKMEDVKRCRRIKACEVADLLPGKCGFCNTTSVGVPVDKRGNSKYPDDPMLQCPEDVITNPSKCPKPPAPLPVTLPDGTVVIPSPEPALCDPVNGKLSVACLIFLATAAGCTSDGAILSILNGDSKGYYTGRGDSNKKYKKAVEIVLKDSKLVTQDAFIGNGVCDRDSALAYYSQLVNNIGSGQTTRTKAASGFLAIGTDFEPCDYDLNQSGPFELYCLERLAREKGCQPDGTDFPTNNTRNKYDITTWGQVNDYFKSLHDNLFSSNQKDLEDASLKCLGIPVKRKITNCGDKAGCEILWFSWDYEWDFPDRPSSQQIFYGREIKSTLPYFNTGGGDYNPYGIQNRMSFHLRTNIMSKVTKVSKIWVMTDDGVAFKVKNITVQTSWRDQGPTAYETQAFTITENKPTKIDSYWYQNYGGSTYIPKIQYDEKGYDVVNPSELQMSVPNLFPLSRWDFYAGDSSERNKVLSSSVDGLTQGVVDGKKAGILGPRSGIVIHNQIRGGAFSSFTFMTYHRGGWARLFAFRKGSCNSGGWSGFSIEGGLCADSRVWFALQRDGAKVELWLSTVPNTVPKNTWFHLAFVLDDDFRGVTVYADSKKIGRKRNEDMNGDDYKNSIFNQVTIGHAAWNCNGLIVPPPSPEAGPPVNTYKYKGCWGDSGDRAISNYSGQVTNADECYQHAKKNKATVFGLQYYGQCFTGTNKDWNRFGKRDDAGCGPLGSGWTNQVYTVDSSSPPDCPPSIDGSLSIGLAWVHWFDYTMNSEDISNDRSLGFTNSAVYPEDTQSGWKKSK